MASHITLRPALRHVVKSSTQSDLRLTFLLPSYATQSRNAPFSTSVPKTYPRDNNRQRGVSSIRRTGPRQPLSVSSLPLPVPVLDASKRSKIEVDPSHGLWDFFHSPEKPISTPEEDKAHGRHWTVEELRGKSWEDLWSLWWVCCKERNRISTENYERERIEAGYGSFEAKTREMTVRRTQRSIKHVLTERYYSWEEARKLARDDSEVDLSGQGVAYTPNAFEEVASGEGAAGEEVGEGRIAGVETIAQPIAAAEQKATV